MGGHGSEEADCAVDIGVVVLKGNLGGLSDRLHVPGLAYALRLSSRLVISEAFVPPECTLLHREAAIGSMSRQPTYLQRRKMDHVVNVRMRLKHFVESLLIGDVEIEILRLLPTYQLNAIEDLFGGVVQVVCDDDFVAGFEEGEGREGANVAGAAAIVG